jgi:hypothetical protein
MIKRKMSLFGKYASYVKILNVLTTAKDIVKEHSTRGASKKYRKELQIQMRFLEEFSQANYVWMMKLSRK